MSINRAFKIAFQPALGTAMFLGIVVVMALIQFIIIEPLPLLRAAGYALGYLLWALSLKLILAAMFGVFVGSTDGALPRRAMLLLALALIAGGMFLLLPILRQYSV